MGFMMTMRLKTSWDGIRGRSDLNGNWAFPFLQMLCFGWYTYSQHSHLHLTEFLTHPRFPVNTLKSGQTIIHQTVNVPCLHRAPQSAFPHVQSLSRMFIHYCICSFGGQSLDGLWLPAHCKYQTLAIQGRAVSVRYLSSRSVQIVGAATHKQVSK